ncbi:hypothetical protein SteCoe_5992 [Stentor coeruleus]|uniref:Uncharacterized protein n=1 Tax=Stentor coeruleus TaxID=5963 RepID=A0A1R2ANC2_9CILI|nr:hypothetical protein SteCoe_37320 [Stentor coeruleus]OMJ66544.1 hypothetical protein SteCoe_36573 [Stentor coeruleus]OMJ66913.1 hypothetical protein SteCoe_36080 [Stentor coeruleus]OMJ66983.1 hypothetical protein SteCoe_35992 [Stentor coeruleus]OMJ67407.1 hypothetical protein SteCoe_35447 [Stentor coeruleus]
MEEDNYSSDLPMIILNKIPQESDKENSLKSNTLEPEMEDCNDTILLKNLIKELGIEESISQDIDPLKHDALSPTTCIHCKLLKKLTTLQTDITKMNQEICATHEILNLKKEQNSDLKNMIRRLEGNLGKNHNEVALENTSSTCSCTGKCSIC